MADLVYQDIFIFKYIKFDIKPKKAPGEPGRQWKEASRIYVHRVIFQPIYPKIILKITKNILKVPIYTINVFL